MTRLNFAIAITLTQARPIGFNETYLSRDKGGKDETETKLPRPFRKK